MTKSRRAGYWLVSEGRRLAAAECLRLQGVRSQDVAGNCTDTEIRGLCGNAMSLCIIEPLLRCALVATGCDPDRLVDRWSDGTAQAELIADAWGSSLPQGVATNLPAVVRRRYDELARKQSGDGGRTLIDLCPVATCGDSDGAIKSDTSSTNACLQPADRLLGRPQCHDHEPHFTDTDRVLSSDLCVEGPRCADLRIDMQPTGCDVPVGSKVEDFLAEHDAFKKTCFSPLIILRVGNAVFLRCHILAALVLCIRMPIWRTRNALP